ncbi:MAG: ABC-type multidrug transport system, ATPase component [Gemmatimonadetes bacterium]|nr:ABC-type multidrug transport system, ATPase component [Gemmatimonadota bacterium]
MIGTDPPDDHAIATHALCKRYGREPALDRVDLRVPEGEVYVLLGVNGAGKSTLFRMLMNLERPDSGRAEVFGRDTRRDGPMVRAQVGYVPERQDAPHRSMTCGRLLQHVATFYPAWDDAYAAHLVRSLEIPTGKRIGELSKGETRRLQLVLALAHRPALLLLDEPTDGLDPVIRRRALALLAEHLADAPTTVLISTHHIHEIESLAGYVGILREGRLVAQAPRDELQRTVRSYQMEVPDGWEIPAELQVSRRSRSSAGRLARCTLVGEEREVIRRLGVTGARVRQVSALTLEEAALAYLPGDPS